MTDDRALDPDCSLADGPSPSPRPDPAPARTAGARGGRLPWIRVAGPGIPYFETETGAAWTPVGQNDAISWHELEGLFGRRDLAAAEAHLRHLADHGVTCLRLMLEYAQVRHRYIERPVGRFVPAMVRLWDDLFALCETVGLRILLTPFDTFWMWLHWHRHPYNRRHGGPLAEPSRFLLDPQVREAIKNRLAFAVARWGGSGALFAWDLWNEIHPAHAEGSAEGFAPFIADLSRHVRALETRLYGRAHPQTVSLFGPELGWRPHLGLEEPIFRHPDLDFATLHIYAEGTIDDPRNTVEPAIAMGRIVREGLAQIRDGRPFLDSEHGPIHSFKDRRLTLPEPFDDEYFRHMQWAHLASGGAGGGMRWPNRHPHSLTAGMRAAQRGLSGFLPLIDWRRFRRRNLSGDLGDPGPGAALFACGDAEQAVIWCLRADSLAPDGRLRRDAAPLGIRLALPGLRAGRYALTAWDTRAGRPCGRREVTARDGVATEIEPPPFVTDVALAVRRV
ncbi:hypothetical protein M446_0089 [Methylobacterium sp. 4-46]|uniref:hypothetical protein n=1 Tax=unclassified Methylobacterium TaxID=2615210 RepID=UPI000152DA46|nr:MULTISPECIES: hypothetical protein [Methylobacterium]ACA14674.1 hypothetical protein M446_0089 [Methylobacterium sp. 4-46]WFT80427.1 hypothetical protein QA634_00450 [Methylobacterium nodulans]